ncbi:MAG TPA: type II secretion system F family protein [candidate division Zixibacteria bacterium]|nr:type II secretion system F family protein [candidate division Zixibacteria bacterium]
MATFSYVVKDSKGNKHEGTVSANSLDAALNKLRESGQTVISVLDTKLTETSKKRGLFDEISLYIYKLRTRIPLGTLVFFTSQMATMFSAGLTIEKALNNLLYEESNKKFKKVVAQLLNDVKKGFSMSDAMERHPGVFSPLYIALVRSGEISGSLHGVLEELADYLEFIQDTKRKILSAMSYPAFVVIVLTSLTIVLMTWVVPMFEGVYAKFNAKLPVPTQILIRVSNVISANFFYTLIGAVVLICGFIVIGLTDTGRKVFDRIKLKIPIMNSIIVNSLMSKFCRTFGMLLGAGVPVVDSLNLVYRVVDNVQYKAAVREATGLIRDGFSIAASLKKTDAFPNTLISLAATGEETGDLDKMLSKAASFYDKQLEAVITRLTSLIEPMLIVLIAIVIGTIVIIIYLPVFYLGFAFRKGIS